MTCNPQFQTERATTERLATIPTRQALPPPRRATPAAAVHHERRREIGTRSSIENGRSAASRSPAGNRPGRATAPARPQEIRQPLPAAAVFRPSWPQCFGLPPSAAASLRPLRSSGGSAAARSPSGRLAPRRPKRHPCRRSSGPPSPAPARLSPGRSASAGPLLRFCGPKPPALPAAPGHSPPGLRGCGARLNTSGPAPARGVRWPRTRGRGEQHEKTFGSRRPRSDPISFTNRLELRNFFLLHSPPREGGTITKRTANGTG